MPAFIMTVALPGAGKTTWANEYAKTCPNSVVVSSDAIREELWGDANDQQNPLEVFETMFRRSVAALKEGKDVVYDATNLVAKTRKATLARVREATKGVYVYAVAVFVACSISECKRRQTERDRQVPNEVIDRMVRQFQTPWYNEGWDYLMVEHCGKWQDIAREHKRMSGESHDNHHHTLSLEAHCVSASAHMAERLNKFHDTHRMVMVEAAFQHDLGKHKTKAFKDTKGNSTNEAHYYSHDNVGAYLWMSGDQHGWWSTRDFFYIGLLIQWHMQPYFLKDEAAFEEWCNKKGFGSEFCKDVLLLHECDLAAH